MRRREPRLATGHISKVYMLHTAQLLTLGVRRASRRQRISAAHRATGQKPRVGTVMYVVGHIRGSFEPWCAETVSTGVRGN